jgi:pimeloyl-ACP methyl ester carboxylesterase
MPYFDNDHVRIYYEIEGKGPDLIMIHGFAANIDVNWRNPNWISTLRDENRLILIDCRGHGNSDKPLNPASYGTNMKDDVIKLMDHLSIAKANFFGYSMGGSIVLSILLSNPERVNSAIIGGYAPAPMNPELAKQFTEPVIAALKADNKRDIKNPIAQNFRTFAESTGADLNALAAVMEGNFVQRVETLAFDSMTAIKSAFKGVKAPVLSVMGSNDALIQNKTLFAESMPGACHFQIQGRDHLGTVPDPRFHVIVKAFLNYINAQ